MSGQTAEQYEAALDWWAERNAQLKADLGKVKAALRLIARADELPADSDTQALDIVVDKARATLKELDNA